VSAPDVQIEQDGKGKGAQLKVTVTNPSDTNPATYWVRPLFIGDSHPAPEPKKISNVLPGKTSWERFPPSQLWTTSGKRNVIVEVRADAPGNPVGTPPQPGPSKPGDVITQVVLVIDWKVDKDK